MKILYITTIGSTMSFFSSFIRELIDMGHTVDIATNDTEQNVPSCYKEWNCRVHTISCTRSPFDSNNLRAVRQIGKLVKDNGYDIIHCHTPIAAACTRLACRRARKKFGVKVFYTAHGFHFYKGAPLKNWLLYYPVEWFCSHFTDKLITINQEDYFFAKRKMKAKEVLYVPGVGVDLSRFKNIHVDRATKRRGIGVPENAILLFSVGELNENKNHKTVIQAIARLENPTIHYAMAGIGNMYDSLVDLSAEFGVAENVHFLGYRNDVSELLNIADFFIFPSYREGLSVSLMEAMAAGLPCLVSSIRGNTDLIDRDGGILFDPHSVSECSTAIEMAQLLNRHSVASHNKTKIQKFSNSHVIELMKSIYSRV